MSAEADPAAELLPALHLDLAHLRALLDATGEYAAWCAAQGRADDVFGIAVARLAVLDAWPFLRGDGGSQPAAELDPGAELLAARLEVEKLRDVLGAVARWEGGSSRSACERALAAPPPDLAPLRDLARAGRHWIDHQPTSPQDDEHICGLQDAIDRAEDAYPFLATAPGSPPAEGWEG